MTTSLVQDYKNFLPTEIPSRACYSFLGRFSVETIFCAFTRAVPPAQVLARATAGGCVSMLACLITAAVHPIFRKIHEGCFKNSDWEDATERVVPMAAFWGAGFGAELFYLTPLMEVIFQVSLATTPLFLTLSLFAARWVTTQLIISKEFTLNPDKLFRASQTHLVGHAQVYV